MLLCEFFESDVQLAWVNLNVSCLPSLFSGMYRCMSLCVLSILCVSLYVRRCVTLSVLAVCLVSVSLSV